jgi:hypothetical protein
LDSSSPGFPLTVFWWFVELSGSLLSWFPSWLVGGEILVFWLVF